MRELECSEGQLSFDRSIRCGPCRPFYSSEGEGSGYNYGKKVKREKDEGEKQKGGLVRGHLPPYLA
jgi:hypothetical protein